jgi:ankyrin repeat protein
LIHALLSAPKIIINARDKSGQTALHIAARARCEPYARVFVKKLLEQPLINANVRDADGKTALYCALESKNFGVARRLLRSEKVNPNAGARDKFPLLLAVKKRYDLNTVESLLESGSFDLDQQTDTGMTALLHAVQNGHKFMAVLLLRAGANPDVPDRTGITARRLLMQPLVHVKFPS